MPDNKRVTLTHKEAFYLWNLYRNLGDSAEDELGVAGADKLFIKLRHAAGQLDRKTGLR